MLRKIKTYFDFSLLPVIFTLAWPTMLEQLMQTAVQYVDTIMVGSLGTEATAAVGATTTVNWLVGSTLSAFGVGFLSYIAKAYGAGDKPRAAKAASRRTHWSRISAATAAANVASASEIVEKSR